MKKAIAGALCTAAVLVLTSTTVFAGTWKNGEGGNSGRWWYDNGDGSYAQNSWQWIDNNQDGIAECYYFDENGWLYTSQTTPDGSMVNENGAWVTNGVVETKAVAAESTTPAQGSGTEHTGGAYLTGYYDANGSWVNTKNIEDEWSAWINKYLIDNGETPYGEPMSAEESAAWDAQFARYQITDSMYENHTMNTVGTGYDITYTVPAANAMDVRDIVNCLGMKLYMKTDGMAEYNAVWTENADGSVQIVFTYKMFG